MGSLGTLAAQLRIDGSSAAISSLRSVGTAVGSLRGLMASLSGPLALVGVSLAAFKSASGFADSLREVFQAGRELQTMARTTGESIGSLKMLQGAFSAAGLEAGAVPDSLRLLQRALGGVNDEGQPTATVFQRLGLSIQQLKGESATQQLQDIGAALNKLPDQSSKAAAAMQIFGRSGSQMLALFSDSGAMAGLGQGLSAQAQIYQRNAATFSRITADLSMLSGKIRGFFVGFADQVGPPLLKLLDGIRNIDLTRIGQQVGGLVATLARAFESGKLSELIGLSLKIGATEGANELYRLTSASVAGLGTLLSANLQTAAGALSGVLEPRNWEGIGHALLAAGLGLESKLLDAKDYFEAGMDFAVQSAMHGLKSAMIEPLKFFQSGWVQAILNPIGLLTDILGKAAAGFGKALMSAMTGNILGASSAAKGLAELTQLASPTGLIDSFAKSLAAGSGAAPDFNTILKGKQDATAGPRANIDAMRASETQAAATIFAPTLKDLAGQLKANFASAGKAVTEALKAPGILDASGPRGQLGSLLTGLQSAGDLWRRIAPSFAGNGPGGSTGSRLGGGMMKMAEGDRLARVGLYIGAGGGPAVDYHRRTAAATEKMVGKFDKVIAALSREESNVAVWG